MRLVRTKSSSSILHTTTANERQREERRGAAEATNELALREVVVVVMLLQWREKAGEGGGIYKMYMSSPAPYKKGERQNEDSFSFSSALYWPHCSGVAAVVRGGGQDGWGGRLLSPPPLRDSHHPPD